jgi:hypothetical protein
MFLQHTPGGRLFGSIALSVIALSSLTHAQDVDFSFVQGIGGPLEENAAGIALDSSGNLYVSGFFQDTTDFDPGAGVVDRTSAGAYDGFIGKYDPSGALLWVHSFGSTSFDYCFGVAVDAAGNAFVTGTFIGTVDFDPGAGDASVTAVSAFSEAFVLKLDTDGNFGWVKVITGPRSEIGISIALDSNDNLYSFGQFSDTPDFDPNGGTFPLTAVNTSDLYVQKLDSDGNFLWAVGVAGRIRDFGRFIALDGSDNLYATASFTGTVDFDPGAGNLDLTSAGANDAFLWKLDPAGALVWAHAFGDAGEDDGFSVALDTFGNVFAAGTYQGTVDFDPSGSTVSLDSFSARSIYVTKFSPVGALSWAGGFTGMDDGFAYGMTVDSSGGPIVVGSFEGTGDFDPALATAANATSIGDEDFYMTKLDAAGNWKWTEQRGTVGRELGGTIITDGAGTLFTTGLYANTLDFDTSVAATNLTAVGGFDTFIMKQVPKAGAAITSNPTPGDIFRNQPLSLIAPAGFSNYVWKRNGLVLAENAPRITGVLAQTLEFDPVLIGDEAVYTVTYDDGTGTILESPPYTLVTAAAPAGLSASGLVSLGIFAALLAMVGIRRLHVRTANESDAPAR